MDEYNNALERAREIYRDPKAALSKNVNLTNEGSIAAIRVALLDLFPEDKLKESEDERIRKEIQEFLRDNCGAGQEAYKKCEEWCYWLEKQKEQKQTDKEQEYVRTLKSLISDFLRGKQEIDREYYQEIWDWLEGRHIEQTHAEWSEEDMKMLDNTLDSLKRYQLSMPNIQVEFQMRWLKSLCPQPKQKRHLGMKDQWCCSAAWAAVRDSDAYNGEEKQFILDFLQRCEPQPHWKPSEQQMKILRKYVMGEWRDLTIGQDKILTSLYNDLKKLM